MRHAVFTMLVMAAALAGCGTTKSGSDNGAGKASTEATANADIKTVKLSGTRGAGTLAERDGRLWIARYGKLLEADPATGKIRRQIAVPVAGRPEHMAVDDDTVWLVIYTNSKERLVGIDVKSGKLRGQPFAIPFLYPLEIVTSHGFVWMASGFKGQGVLYRYDPKAGRFTKRIAGTGNRGLAGNEDALWVTSGDKLVKVDPATARVVGRSPLAEPGAGFVAVGDGVVWTGSFGGTFERHDPASGKSIDGNGPQLTKTVDSMASGPLGTWITDNNAEQIIRLDPKTGDAAERIGGVDSQEITVGEKAIYGTGPSDEPSIWIVTPKG